MTDERADLVERLEAAEARAVSFRARADRIALSLDTSGMTRDLFADTLADMADDIAPSSRPRESRR